MSFNKFKVSSQICCLAAGESEDGVKADEVDFEGLVDFEYLAFEGFVGFGVVGFSESLLLRFL